ncbi:23S rRNA pseudouridine2457 synthase [Lewinella aquimaris]|uniref:Pseudouridine synthase n=1 Tax=Neolewinella aquimaris TaxID=1835722 RepID=A0A840E9W9_9BACT|nr:pseudouridine synthase [Neolewinella aquimaris]MBB4077816.1 23S rRNA pseudouridine2457 synthase [Neolewinella aquimaris]
MRYFLINKPFGTLSQFTREAPEHRTLADLYDFPPGVYPVGRLDRDSEGLLLLTDDKRLNHRLLDPSYGHARTYWVQVEGKVTEEAIRALAAGPVIRIKGKEHHSRPVGVERIAPALPPRDPPIRVRQQIPDTWLALTLREGKNRQVRRMCAAVGHPVLRLLRYAIEDLTLADLAGQHVREVSVTYLLPRLKIK